MVKEDSCDGRRRRCVCVTTSCVTHMRRRWLFLLPFWLVLAGGCKVGPDFFRPAPPPLQPEYLASSEDESQTIDSLTYWWTYFNEPVLNQLVAEACRRNYDLEEAFYRIVEARARLGVVKGNLFPQVNNGDSYAFRQSSTNANQFVAINNLNQGFNLYGFGFDSSWEIDVFGKIRRSIEAARADLAAQQQLQQDVKVTLLADVAATYVTIRVLQKRIEIAESNLQIQKQSVELVQRRLDAGLARPLDMAQAQSIVHLTAAAIPALKEQLQIALNQLSVLLGMSPSEELVSQVGVGSIPDAPDGLGVGMPGELLSRRPDVRQAELDVAAASARIGVACAELYPQFTIRGDVSLDARTLSSIAAIDSMAYNVGPSVRWNILNFGRVKNRIRAQRARYFQAVANYRGTILRAVEEVENGLTSYHKQAESVEQLRLAVDATSKAVELSQTQYKTGLVAFQTVLDSQRQLLLAQEQLASSQGNVVLSLIRTYKALGGGWDADCTIDIAPPVEDLPDPIVEEPLENGLLPAGDDE